MTEITDNHRAVLRALADTIVPSIPRDDDPTGFWAASGSAMGADIAVAQVISGLPDDQRHGLLSLLDGMHVFGFATGSQRSREQVIRNVALMGTAPAAGMKALASLTTAMAYSVPDPTTGVNPAWQVYGYEGPPRMASGGPEPLATFAPTESTCAADDGEDPGAESSAAAMPGAARDRPSATAAAPRGVTRESFDITAPPFVSLLASS